MSKRLPSVSGSEQPRRKPCPAPRTSLANKAVSVTVVVTTSEGDGEGCSQARVAVPESEVSDDFQGLSVSAHTSSERSGDAGRSRQSPSPCFHRRLNRRCTTACRSRSAGPRRHQSRHQQSRQQNQSTVTVNITSQWHLHLPEQSQSQSQPHLADHSDSSDTEHDDRNWRLFFRRRQHRSTETKARSSSQWHADLPDVVQPQPQAQEKPRRAVEPSTGGERDGKGWRQNSTTKTAGSASQWHVDLSELDQLQEQGQPSRGAESDSGCDGKTGQQGPTWPPPLPPRPPSRPPPSRSPSPRPPPTCAEERRERLTSACRRFSAAPARVVNELVSSGVLRDARDVAVYLHEHRAELDGRAVGEYLATAGELPQAVLREYLSLLDVSELPLLAALRLLLTGFLLHGEQQGVSRVLETFADEYLRQNPGCGLSEDACRTTVTALVILHTDLHELPRRRGGGGHERMTADQFVASVARTGQRTPPPDELRAMYRQLSAEPLPMPAGGGRAAAELRAVLSRPDHSGWLCKQGGRYKTWRRRWFALKHNCLYYFEDPADAVHAGVRGMLVLENVAVRETPELDIHNGFEVLPLPDPAAGTDGAEPALLKSSKRVNGSMEHGHHETFRVSAPNQREAAEWMRAIRRNVVLRIPPGASQAQAPPPSPSPSPQPSVTRAAPSQSPAPSRHPRCGSPSRGTPPALAPPPPSPRRHRSPTTVRKTEMAV